MTQWLHRCSHSWEPQHHTLDIFDIYLLATVTLLNCWIAVFWVDSWILVIEWFTNLTVFWHEVFDMLYSCCIFVAFVTFSCCFLFFLLLFEPALCVVFLEVPQLARGARCLAPEAKLQWRSLWVPNLRTTQKTRKTRNKSNSKARNFKNNLTMKTNVNKAKCFACYWYFFLRFHKCSSACFQLYMLFWGSDSPSTCGYCKRRISTFLCTGTQRCKRINFGFLIKLFDGQRGQLLWQAFVYLQRLLLECGTDLALPWAGSRRTLVRDGRCCFQFNTRRTDVRCFLYSLHLPSIECQKLKLPMHTKVLCTALSRNVGNQDTLWQRGWGLFASSTNTLASFQSDAISPALLLQEELEFDAWKECLEQACQTQKMVSVSVSCVMKCPYNTLMTSQSHLVTMRLRWMGNFMVSSCIPQGTLWWYFLHCRYFSLCFKVLQKAGSTTYWHSCWPSKHQLDVLFEM